jgi:hypothetical protein
MKTRLPYYLRYALLLGIALALLPLIRATALADDEGSENGAGYVNPFWEENQELYREAMVLQGYLMPGVAYNNEDVEDAQARHYNALPDNIVLGDSKISNRYEPGTQLDFNANYIDNHNAGAGFRYDAGDYLLKGGFDLSEFASIEDTPGDVRTTWTRDKNYGFQVMAGNLLAGWSHREADRDWEYSGLDGYKNDRIDFSYGMPFASGDLDLGLAFSNLDSNDLNFNGRNTIIASANGRFPVDSDTDFRLGYGGIWAQKPGDLGGDAFSKFTVSTNISKRNFISDDFDASLFGNYVNLGNDQTLNTHYDKRYNWGGKGIYNPNGCLRLEGGFWTEYFDVEHLRWEMPDLGQYMLVPGLTADDLEEFTVRNYGHAYNSYLKGRVKFANGGFFSQEVRFGRHYDNQAPDGAEDTGIDAQQPLTLYTRWDWTTGLNIPLSNDTSWQLTNSYRKWDMRLRESEGNTDTLATSINWNPSDDTGLSFHYENLTNSFAAEAVDSYAADQYGFGVDGWHRAQDDLSYNGGIFWGKGTGEFNSFDKFGIYYSVVFGTDGKWKLKLEYNKSSADDYDALDFNVFDGVLYYKIDI